MENPKADTDSDDVEEVAAPDVDLGKNKDSSPNKDGAAANVGESKNEVPAETAERTSSWLQRNSWLVFVSLFVLALGLILGLTLRDRGDVEEPPPPHAVDYSTGVSLVTYYGVETVVRSRLARTTVTIDVANALDCSSIHSITLQLPLAARVTSLETVSEDCTTRGEVQELKEARETFLETAAQGLPGAYIEEQDSSTHGMQVAIPPLGTTRVKLVLEELLQQRLGKVEFQTPLAPNEEIDQIMFDLKVEDLTGGPVEFHLDLDNEIIEQGLDPEDRSLAVEIANNATNATNTTDFPTEPVTIVTRFHLDIPDAREYTLPKVLRGWYHPADIEDSGMLATDGVCFEHFFLPNAEPMPRNLVFLLDASGSDFERFEATRVAIKNFINTLTDQDRISIQTYGSRGTLDLWGPAAATSEGKEDAALFLDSFEGQYSNTDLQEAFLEALLRAKRDAEKSSGNTATILVAVAASYPNRGEIDRAKIATNIYKLNQEGEVKIYTLGFPGQTDMQLLDAIALVNGGVSGSVLRGSDYASQILTFLENEIGTILLSDVRVSVTGEGSKVVGETQASFPLLADGSEVVVRGLIEVEDSSGGETGLQASTTAATTNGPDEWTVSAIQDFYSPTGTNGEMSLCFQSYAHERITQLLRLRDAAEFMESNVISELVNLVDDSCNTEKLAECLEDEALALALRGNVVVKGLTAMVTVDDEECLSVDEDAEVCLDGTAPGGTLADDSGDGRVYTDEDSSEGSPSGGSRNADYSPNIHSTYPPDESAGESFFKHSLLHVFLSVICFVPIVYRII